MSVQIPLIETVARCCFTSDRLILVDRLHMTRSLSHHTSQCIVWCVVECTLRKMRHFLEVLSEYERII